MSEHIYKVFEDGQEARVVEIAISRRTANTLFINEPPPEFPVMFTSPIASSAFTRKAAINEYASQLIACRNELMQQINDINVRIKRVMSL